MESNKVTIIDMYLNQNLSTYVIAERFNTYHQKIVRYLKKWGVPLKSRSNAQKLALASGRFEHPTKGKQREAGVKKKISNKMAQNWSEISDAEREKRIEKARENWNNLSDSQKKSLHEEAHKAIRESAKIGSKLERFIYEALVKAGYGVIFHKTELIPNNKLELDLFIPSHKLAIEIDGPSHFNPIWGEAKLLKTMNADMSKGGLLNANGYHLLRVKQVAKSISQFQQEKILTAIIAEINKLESSQNPQYITIEV